MKDDKQNDRQGVALSDAEIERIFYPSGGADYLQLQIARNIGRAMERAVMKRASLDLTDDQIKEIAKKADCKWLFGEYTLSMKAFARAILSRASSSRAEVEIPWDRFPAWLIDHCEGDTITEEGLQHALAAMLAAAEAPKGDQS